MLVVLRSARRVLPAVDRHGRACVQLGCAGMLVGPLLPPGVKNAAMVLLAVGVGMKLRSRL